MRPMQAIIAAVTRHRRFALVALSLVVAVAAVYGQVRDHAFLNYDDDIYITANRLVTGEFSWDSVTEAFGIRAANWHPLTWFSHILDWRLFGAWAGGHLLENALLHALNAVLLFALLASTTGAFWPAAAVAAVFALHPLRVESVAWASERKDVLSALLWLLTTGAYVRSVRRPGAGSRVAVHVLYLLGLAAKPMLVTLPFTLLLLDWWPLGRARVGGAPAGGAGAGRGWAGLVGEKALLFALAFAASLVTYLGQTSTIVPYVRPSLPTRLANAVVSYALYLRDLLWPGNLAFLYPYPREGVPAASFLAAAALLVALTALALRLWRRQPWLAVGWLWYLGTLVPVIGLVQPGATSRSDRYTYLTLVGVTAALAWAAARALPRTKAARGAAAALVVAALAGLSWSAWRYVGAWKDSYTLMAYTAAVTKDNYIVLNNLGSSLSEAGRTEESLHYLREALRVKPDHCNARYNLGANLRALGRHREAYQELSTALQCYGRERTRRDYVFDTHMHLGAVCLEIGLPAEAELHYAAALQIAPGHPGARAGQQMAQQRRRPGR